MVGEKYTGDRKNHTVGTGGTHGTHIFTLRKKPNFLGTQKNCTTCTTCTGALFSSNSFFTLKLLEIIENFSKKLSVLSVNKR